MSREIYSDLAKGYTYGMLEITPEIRLDDDEIKLTYISSPGPGGQNVNKLSTAVQLRFDVRDSPSITNEVKQRLVRLAGKRLTSRGILIIESHQYRSQELNRQAALERLARLIQRASQAPKPRHKTKPTRASILRRLATKRKRSEIKRMRHDTGTDE
jgi:ribosome-associated protein